MVEILLGITSHRIQILSRLGYHKQNKLQITCVKIPKFSVVVYPFTLCYFMTYYYLVGLPHSHQPCLDCLFLVVLDSLLVLINLTEITLPLGRTKLSIIHIHIIILFICLLTNPGYCDQDPFIPVFSIHEFSKCVTGIFSLVIFHDFICDSDIIDILPSSFQGFPQFSLRGPLRMINLYGFRTILCRRIRRVFFNPDILIGNFFIFYHVSQKTMTNINVLVTHTNLPILC